MSLTDLFWLFFMFSALQPVLRQRMLEAMRMRKIAKLERKRNSRVILLVHRQETMRLLGFPVMRYIDVNDSEEVLRAIQMTDEDVPLDIILHTPGGLVLAALQIARAIRNHKGTVTVLVPHYAMSGGTLIALAADEIVMSRHAVLGPIDPQLGQFPGASLIKVVEQKPMAEIDDETLILADVSRKAIVQVKNAARELLDRRLSREQAETLAEKLSTGTWTHDYPISPEEAKELGLSCQHRHAERGAGADGPLPATRSFTSRAASNICRSRGRRRRHGDSIKKLLRVHADSSAGTSAEMHDQGVGNGAEGGDRGRTPQWRGLTVYQKFEHAIILILTGLIAVVIVSAVWNLALQDTVQSGLVGYFDPTDPAIFQTVFGMIFTVIIALEFKRSLLCAERKESVVQVRAVILIAMLAIVRKLIILDLATTEALQLIALAAATLSLGGVYWLVRDQDRRHAVSLADLPKNRLERSDSGGIRTRHRT